MPVEANAELNDVDIDAVGRLIDAVESDPAKANSTWAAQVAWTGGFSSSATVRSFPPVPSDEPAILGGADTAPNPVEQLLAALGNCLAVGYAANATIAGITIKSLRVDLTGNLDLRVFLGISEGYAGFTDITAQVHLDADASAEALEALHARVVASSPVGHTLGTAVPLTIVRA